MNHSGRVQLLNSEVFDMDSDEESFSDADKDGEVDHECAEDQFGDIRDLVFNIAENVQEADIQQCMDLRVPSSAFESYTTSHARDPVLPQINLQSRKTSKMSTLMCHCSHFLQSSMQSSITFATPILPSQGSMHARYCGLSAKQGSKTFLVMQKLSRSESLFPHPMSFAPTASMGGQVYST